MKHFSKNSTHFPSQFSMFIGCMLFALIMTGCSKWDDLTSPKEGSVYMPQAYADRSKLKLFKIDSAQVATFGAAIGGFNGAPEQMTVAFEIDNGAITQFNKDHSYLNYNFVALPVDAYTLSGTEATIEKGASNSNPLTISILASKLETGVDYCLPVRIKSISAGSLDTIQSISYFMIDSLYIRSRDVTNSGHLTVSNENSNGIDSKEASPKLVDNDLGTKYLYNYVKDSWMQLKMDAAVKLNAYTITSGNDANGRDPKNWQFQGSNDGSTWKVLDERKDYMFTDRTQTITFELNQADNQAYSYYRMVVNENNSSDLLQITEWRLLQYY